MIGPVMELWRSVWRAGFAPLIPTGALESLEVALRTDDERLTQGSTTTPPPLMCVQGQSCEAGCILGYCGAVVNGGFGVATVGEVEEWFAKACFDADQRLGEPAACRHWLSWFDDAPRNEMLREMLAEVQLELADRLTGQHGEENTLPVGGPR